MRLAVASLAAALCAAPLASRAAAPAFDCTKARGTVERLVCSDAALAALDRKMSSVFAGAMKNLPAPEKKIQRTLQRGWIKGRNECWKSDDKRACVTEAYRTRIAELQARYRLVPGSGPVTYVCDGQPANEVMATFFKTDPPTLIAERGDSVSLMYLQPSASGARYRGRNESLWEHHGEATITWGYGAPEMRCKLRKP
jgi:uncharacterized protein